MDIFAFKNAVSVVALSIVLYTVPFFFFTLFHMHRGPVNVAGVWPHVNRAVVVPAVVARVRQ